MEVPSVRNPDQVGRQQGDGRERPGRLARTPTTPERRVQFEATAWLMLWRPNVQLPVAQGRQLRLLGGLFGTHRLEVLNFSEHQGGRVGKLDITDRSSQGKAGETHLSDEVQLGEIVGFYEKVQAV